MSERETYAYLLTYSVRPWIGYRYPAFVLFAFEKEGIGALSRCIGRNAFVSIGRFICRSIRAAPAATRLKPSGENIVSDLASPPATTSLLLAMISYSTSRERGREREDRKAIGREGEEERRGRIACEYRID